MLAAMDHGPSDRRSPRSHDLVRHLWAAIHDPLRMVHVEPLLVGVICTGADAMHTLRKSVRAPRRLFSIGSSTPLALGITKERASLA